MKTVLKTNNIYKILLIQLLLCGCIESNNSLGKKENKKNSSNQNEAKFDSTKYVLQEFPIEERVDYFIDCKKMNIGLIKRLTSKDVSYVVDIKYGDFQYDRFQIPIYREAQDFYPIIRWKLSNEVERAFSLTPENCFIVDFSYGTSHVRWNYLFQVNNEEKKIILKDIYYKENMSTELSQNNTDQSIHLYKFSIESEMMSIPELYIDSLFHHFDEVKSTGKRVKISNYSE